MARARRIQFPGGVYHVMSRGNRRRRIFEDDHDRQRLIDLMKKAVERYEIRVYEYCLMDNHYHVVLDTPCGNLSRPMQYVNGVFSQWSNRQHRRTGHLLEGRFRSIVVPRELYLKRVCRYVVLNPVNAGLVSHAAQWPWSSYRATVGLAVSPPFLHLDWMRWAFNTDSLQEAQLTYRLYVNESPPQHGKAADDASEAFDDVVEELSLAQRELAAAQYRDRLLPRTDRDRLRPTLPELFDVAHFATVDRRRRIHEAHVTHGYCLAEIARFLKVHPSTPGAILRRWRDRGPGSA